MRSHWLSKTTLLLLALVTLAACSTPATALAPTAAPSLPPPVEATRPPTAAPTVAPTNPPTVAPTSTESLDGPPQALPMAYHLDLPAADKIHYDFFDHLCEAQWSNGAHKLDCPGDLTSPNGSASQLSPQTVLSFATDNKVLVTIPAYGNNNSSIFGHYPAYTIQPGDKFKGALSVAFDKNENCALNFGLGYYDAQNKYHDLTEWPINNINAIQEVDYDLSVLNGQAVGLTLLVRYSGKDSCEALWIAPLIYGN